MIEAARIIIPVTTNAAQATAQMRGLQGSLVGLRSGMSGVAAGAGIAAIAVAGMAAAAYGFVRAAEAQVRAERKLDAVLRSTRNAVGLTHQELTQMAAALQQVTTFGDEAIIEAQALMLTFTRIGRDVFPEAMEMALDMSEALGQDLKSSVLQLGKALNDPIVGAAALRRVGVSLTEQQMEQIRVLQQSGRLLEAQAIVMNELRTEFGGMARELANTPMGQLRQLSNMLGDIGEQIGMDLTPDFLELIGVVRQFIASDGFREFARAIGEALRVALQLVTAVLRGIGSVASALGNLIQRVGRMLPGGRGPTRVEVENPNAPPTRFAGGGFMGQSGLRLVSQAEVEAAQAAGLYRPAVAPSAGEQAAAGAGSGQTAAERALQLAKDLATKEAEINQTRLDQQKEFADKSVEIERQRMQEFQNALSNFQMITGAMADVGQAYLGYRQASIDAEISKMRERGASDEEIAKRQRKLNRKMAKEQKAINLFSAIVDTAAGVTRAYVHPGGIAGFVLASLIAAKGALQIAMIQKTPLPSAQYGGSFSVPPGYSADSGLLRVNSGERVDVTPARHSGGGSEEMTVKIGEQDFNAYLTKQVDRILNSGSVQIRRRGVVKVA